MLNLRLPLIAALVAGLTALGAHAADATQEPTPAKSTMTKEEKAAARKAKRAEAKGQPVAADAVQDKAPAASGTSAQRKAERAAKRAELKEANKKGEIPRANEGGVTPPAASAAKK